LTLYSPFAYLLYNLGWVILLSVIFGAIVSLALYKQNRMGAMLRVGLASWAAFSGCFDLWQPPLYLSTSGHVLIPMGTAALENVSVDGMSATLWRQLFMVFSVDLAGSSWWFILTYVATSLIAISAMVLLLSPKQFVRLFKGASGA
jgi:hypothetical protein